MMSFKTISANLINILIFISQMYCFYIKISDSTSLETDPIKYLYKENRDKHIEFYFLARNFRSQVNIETVSILFMIVNIVSSLRIL